MRQTNAMCVGSESEKGCGMQANGKVQEGTARAGWGRPYVYADDASKRKQMQCAVQCGQGMCGASVMK